MTSGNNYTRLWQQLTPLYGRDEAVAIARLVMESLFGLTLTDIVCGRADSLSAEDQARLDAVSVRLATGEPVQYVLGEASFCGRMFHVAPGVLIPRPETETLCQTVIDTMGQQTAPRVLDIGTGSGCIAVTLALGLNQPQVTAWDISDDALAIARDNARRLGAEVTFERRDALRLQAETEPQWDVIVSNPPYVTLSERATMHDNVLRHEPATALFVPDNDPLRFYRAIAAYAVTALRPGGRLFFEINPRFAKEMAAMLTGMGYAGAGIVKDQFGKERIIALPPLKRL